VTDHDDTALKPRPRFKPRASARTQLALAGFVWAIGALVLGVRAVAWLAPVSAWPLLAVLALALGALKARFILEPTARKAIARIERRGTEACAGGFLSWQSWLLVIGMVALGHALRLTAIPRPTLAVVYGTVATALLIAGRLYWRAAFKRA